MSRGLPPAWIMRFFRWFCHEDLCDAVEGDLLTVYDQKRAQWSRWRSNAWYFLTVLSFLQPFALKRQGFAQRLGAIDLMQSYLKIGYRNLLANRAYALINITGLAIGLAAFVVMTSYVVSEFSFDRFHEKGHRIYRLSYSYEARGETVGMAGTAFPIKPMLLERYPGVEQVVRFFHERESPSTLRFEEYHFTEEGLLFSDPEVFEVFDFELERGDPKTALMGINSIVLSQELATKYFGNEDPMGQIIEYNAKDQLKVTGILKPVPSRSHLQFDALMPVELQRQRWIRGDGNIDYDLEQDWRWPGAWQYVLLENESALAGFNSKLLAEGHDQFGYAPEADYRYSAQPITEIHLNPKAAGEVTVRGNLRQIYGFGAIAILILAIACINFINLSTAQSARRAKEVGLRKVMGAHRPQLIGQLMAESVLIPLLATALSILLIEAMLPAFNRFMDLSLSIPYLENPLVLPAFLLGSVTIGLMAGAYPALYISRFRPVKTLKGQTTTGSKSDSRLRKGLVTFQFIISNLLIMGVLIIQQQLSYIEDKDLGFNKDQVVVLKYGGRLDNKYGLFQKELESLPTVAATNIGYIAGTTDWTKNFLVNGVALEEAKNMGIKHVSIGFLDMYNMQLVAGRNFEHNRWEDWKRTVLLNEKAVKNFGWTNEEALGKEFSYVTGRDNRTRFYCKVIGIVADAHLESLYQPIRPSVFKRASWGNVSIKLNVGGGEVMSNAMADIEGVWNELMPEWPFEYEMLDDTLQGQYRKEERLGQTIQYFTLLTIFIAGLGLFGLAAYSVQQRRREIGVRKVLGASVGAILSLVSRGFFALVAFSFLVSVPLGFYLSDRWLRGFEYRIEPGIGALTSLTTLL